MNLESDFDTLSIDTLALEEPLKKQLASEIAELERLEGKVCYLHTSLLYYRNEKSKVGAVCYEAWRSLIKKVGGSPYCWKDLGYYLGLSQADLDYIWHSVKDDPTDTVLKVFRQDEKATLDKICTAFSKMQRYDILKAIEGPFQELAECFNREDNKSTDTGYHSQSKDNDFREIISFNKLPNDLPAALSRNMVIQDKPDKRRKVPKQQLQKVNENKEITDDTKILLLTYTEDGMETALNLQERVNNWSDDDIKVIAITLNDKREELLKAPEVFIKELFEKVTFVVPLITPDYFQAIKLSTPTSPTISASDNLDIKYVNYIYNLIVNNYIYASGCRNTKVRSVLPEGELIDSHSSAKYMELMPWTNEFEFDEQFKEYLKFVDLDFSF